MIGGVVLISALLIIVCAKVASDFKNPVTPKDRAFGRWASIFGFLFVLIFTLGVLWLALTDLGVSINVSRQ